MSTRPQRTAQSASTSSLPGADASPSGEADGDLRLLLGRAKAGDPAALARFVELASGDLIRVVRRHLPRRLRRVCDSQDFIQAVWATFMVDRTDPEDFASSAHLLAYIRRVAANKVTDEVRRRLIAKKASLCRDVPLDAVGDLAGRSDAETPSKIAIARERLELILRDQPEHYRRLLELKAAGASNAEAAAAAGLNEGTVRRVLAQLSRRVAKP